MEAILEYTTTISEFIMANYTWILGGAIIIFLAIIGSYADKTNFGQGKKDETDKEKSNLDGLDESKIYDKPINEALNIQNDEVKSLKTEQEDLSKDDNGNVSKQQDNLVEVDESHINDQDNVISDETSSVTSFDDNFEKFDKEFNEFLPKKEVINNELLDEIENLSLDKTQKIDLTNLPDLDDVELPKIKSLATEEDDIWKF